MGRLRVLSVICCFLFVIVSPSSMAAWKAGWAQISGIGFSPSDSKPHVSVNLKWTDPPSGVLLGSKTEVIILQQDTNIETLNRMFTVLLSAMHAKDKCWVWFDEGNKIHRNRHKLGDVFCEKK